MIDGFKNVLAKESRERGIHLAFVSMADRGLAGELRNWLTAAERRFLESLHYQKRRMDWLGGRLAAKEAVRKLLNRETGGAPEPRQLEIMRAATGLPVLRIQGISRQAEAIRVTISHSGEVAGAAAFRASEAGAVGLDIERVEHVEPALYRIAFTPEEISLIQRSATVEDRRDLVLRLWTAKEAVLKAVETGLRASLQAVAVSPGAAKDAWLARFAQASFLVQTAFACGYVVSLAVSVPGEER